MEINQFSIKYRPRKFDEIFGQENIVKELKNRAKTQNWPNAMLFRGKYGTGKTTLARVTSMSINCSNPDSENNPCGKCPSCLSIINETYNRDTLVFDGSTLGTKEEIVDFVTQNIDYPPMYDKKKVLIIEEADQLSKSAVNSLHKVLEKPRPHVVFILLSMSSGSVPPSIVSRCQTYNLKELKPSQIMTALKEILWKEGLWDSPEVPREFKTQGLALIAQASAGSLRTAVQLLERALIGKYYTPQELEENLSIVDEFNQINLVRELLDLNLYPIFTKLESMDVYEFINYILLVLSNARALRLTGYSKNEYFDSQNFSIANHPNFSRLCITFQKLASMSKPYIRKSEVIIELCSYLESCKVQSTEQQKNVQQKVRIRGITV